MENDIKNLEWKKIGNADWYETSKKAKELGEGWRLPTIEELQSASLNKINYGANITERYWSSTEDGEDNNCAFIHLYYSNRSWLEDKRHKNVVYNMCESFYGVLVREKDL